MFPKITKKKKKERNKNPMKPSKQKFDFKSDAKLTSLRQRKMSASDGRIKLFQSMKTINLTYIDVIEL